MESDSKMHNAQLINEREYAMELEGEMILILFFF